MAILLSASGQIMSFRATIGLQPKQMIGDGGKERGIQQVKCASRPKNMSDPVKPQKDRSVHGNKKDGEGCAEGFAVLAALKAQLLQKSPSSEISSVLNSPRVNVQDRLASDQRSSKLSSTPRSQKDPKSTFEKAELLQKVSASETRVQPFSNEAKVQVYLSNLPNQLTTKEFDTVMRSVPGLLSWKLAVDQGGSCRGYGFCEVRRRSDDSAIELLSRISIHGKPVIARFSDSENPKPSDGKQNNSSLTSSSHFHGSNISMKQSQRLTPEDQTVIGILPQIGETQLRGVRRISAEVDMDQSLKFLSHTLQNPEKQIASSSSLMGESIFKAIQKASAERPKSRHGFKKPSRRVKKNVQNNESREKDFWAGEVHPIIVKPEWDLELKSLETCLAAMKKLL